MIVRELITRLGFNLDQSSINKADAATNRLKNQANETAFAFRNILATVGSLMSLRGIIRIGDEMQDLRSRIGLLPQTITDTGTAIEVVEKHATASGVALQAYGTLYTRIGNAAKDYITTQEDLLGITDTISKALTVSGASTQEAASVMIQFSQALGAGTLQGEEFRAMAEAAPQYLDQLSKHLGYRREDLKKLASQGKLTSREVIEATRKMAEFFDEKFRQMPIGVAKATTMISNRFSIMIDKMNRESLIITRIAMFMLGMFDKIEEGVNKVVKAFGGWSNTLRFLGIVLGTIIGAKALQMLVAYRVAIIAAFLPFLKAVVIIGAVSLALEDLYLWIEGNGDSLLESLIGPWEEWRPYAVGAIEIVVNTFKELWAIVSGIGKVLFNLFTLDEEGFKDSVANLTVVLREIFSSWGSMMVSAFSVAFTAILKYFTSDLPAALRILARLIYDSVFTSLVNAIKDGWGSLKAAPGNILRGLFNSGGENRANDQSRLVPQVNISDMARGTPGANSMTNNTTVNVTVPPGTTAEQAAFIEETASKSFTKASDEIFARDLAMFSR